MTALEYFRQFAPEFSALSDAQAQSWLDSAALFVRTDCLDDERGALATALYAAHLAKMTDSAAGGVSGSVKSEREGDLSRSYGAVAGDATWLGQSPYGLQYLNITAVCAGSAIMTRYGSQSYY